MEARTRWIEYREQHKKDYGAYVYMNEMVDRVVSPFQTIEIYHSDTFGKMLVIDGFINTTEKDEFIYHEMLTHVALYSHTSPKHVLIIGGGDGGAMREIFRHRVVECVDLVDIDGMVIEICKKHLPQMAVSFKDPRARVHVEDGAAFLKNSKDNYDIIIIDSTDPVGPGECLFSQEFYECVNKHLNPGGILVLQGGPGSNNMQNYVGIYPRLKKNFEIMKPYVATIDTYGGLWTLGYASQTCDPVESFRAADYKRDDFDFFYYNDSIHKGCFSLPTYHRKRLFA